jgi:hypothetical protein
MAFMPGMPTDLIRDLLHAGHFFAVEPGTKTFLIPGMDR